MMQKQMANALRFLSADMIERAKSGHPGMPLGMADIATVLWTKFLRFDAKNPSWFNRDRFILSNGHGSALMYSLLYVLGYEDISLDDLKNFRQLGSPTAGHPERHLLQGIDFSTGPLGQGLTSAVGMALAERLLNARFGNELVDHKTYVFVGDGCLMEGISEEAISLAGHLNLNKLIVLWDNNHITIDGDTSITTSTNMHKRFESNGWRIEMCDGHDFASIERALRGAQTSDKPVLIDCKTTIGYGAIGKEGTPKCHGAPLGADVITDMRKNLNWDYAPFDIPEDILRAWNECGLRGQSDRLVWDKTVKKHPKATEFLNFISGNLPDDFTEQMAKIKADLLNQTDPIATRKASQIVLSKLTQLIPNLIGGSADLTPANYTNTPTSTAITKENYAGNYINYGIREHAMAAIMNGIVAHGGFIPYGGTFLSFVDYMKPAIRLGALMNLRTLYVLTHDSIGVGEDGPTHQPIEQLAMLRATPNTLTFRPADLIETAECYETALAHNKPTALALSRQNLPLLRTEVSQNHSAKGGYVLFEPDTERRLTLLATGSEVSLAMTVKNKLAKFGIAAAVVSMPCIELFEEQTQAYQLAVLGKAPRLAIEAASPMGWHKWIGCNGQIVSMDGFGASAPASKLFERYGFTTENVTNIALTLLRTA
ncbi:MAG: transketolase [Alphaproteobacteria bacterium]|nr:transketolase [Alphaproteobacteria bacterium]